LGDRNPARLKISVDVLPIIPYEPAELDERQVLLAAAPLSERFDRQTRQLSNVLRGEQLHTAVDDVSALFLTISRLVEAMPTDAVRTSTSELEVFPMCVLGGLFVYTEIVLAGCDQPLVTQNLFDVSDGVSTAGRAQIEEMRFAPRSGHRWDASKERPL
jgi:hypothetical protein